MSAVTPGKRKYGFSSSRIEARRLREAAALDPVAALARLGERIEVVAGADVENRLPLVVHLLELAEHAVRRVERHLRALAHIARALRRLQQLEHLAGGHRRAANLRDARGDQLAVVGQANLDDDGPLENIATRSPSCSSVFDDRRDEPADVRRVLRLEMQVVDEDQQHAAASNRRPAAAAPSAARCPPARAAAALRMVLKVRPPCTSANESMVCGTPSSRTVKLSLVRSGMKRPLSSRGITSVVTCVTAARNVGVCGGAGGGFCATEQSRARISA